MNEDKTGVTDPSGQNAGELTKTTDSKVADLSATEPKAVGARTTDTKSGGKESAKTTDAKTADSKSSDAKAADSKSSDSKSAEKDGKKADGKQAPKKKNKKSPYTWGVFIFFLSLVLTVLFSFLAELAVENSGIGVCIAVLFALLVLNILADVLANAVVTCPTESLLSMASHKVRGAKRAVNMCKNATKIASIFADVIGDICGIVSGAAGAALALFIVHAGGGVPEIVASIGTSAVIGALTVGGKAISKPFAVQHNVAIVFGVAKFSTYFIKEKNAR